MNSAYGLLVGMILGAVLALFIIWLKYKPNKVKEIKESIEIFRLLDNNFHIIKNGFQYRHVAHITNDYFSKTYKFPSGVQVEGNECDEFRGIIFKFRKYEEAEKRRKLYEAEMFIDLSDSFSKWDKEFSTKALNK
jgi:hypothetical protein